LWFAIFIGVQGSITAGLIGLRPAIVNSRIKPIGGRSNSTTAVGSPGMPYAQLVEIMNPLFDGSYSIFEMTQLASGTLKIVSTGIQAPSPSVFLNTTKVWVAPGHAGFQVNVTKLYPKVVIRKLSGGGASQFGNFSVGFPSSAVSLPAKGEARTR